VDALSAALLEAAMISMPVDLQSTRRLCRFVVAFAALACAFASVASHAQTPPPVTSTDFARDASEHFTTQLESARVAQTKSKDAAVRSLASRVAAEAEQADRALVKLTEELKIDLPSQSRANPAAAGAAPRAPEASFDDVYTLELSQALAKAETSFDAALRSPKVDPKLKDFARQQLSAIREDRKHADPLARRQATQRPTQGAR
jgi:predicted outer membrane protein